MTEQEKNMIAAYREEGLSYTAISNIMDLSVNSIKTYCRRHALGGVRISMQKDNKESSGCECCGRDVKQLTGRKKKRFCSDRCRNKWWNSHLDLVKRKANYEYECPACHKTFVVYGNASRKYCSHECYIEDRFGGK